MRLRRNLGAAALVVTLAGSTTTAQAVPVAVEAPAPTIQSSDAGLSLIGREVHPASGGVLVVAEADLGLTSVVFVADADPTVSSDVTLLGPVAAQGERMVGIDAAGDPAVEAGVAPDPLTPIVRLFRMPESPGAPFTETGVAALPEQIRTQVRRFGTSIAIGGNAIAVVSETTARSDRIDIFRLSPAGTAEWFQELLPQTLDTKVAISTSGATIVTSGVSRLAASGELIINRIGPDGWVPTQRFLRIGGGPVEMDGDRIFVQRNGFFARSSGSWTLVQSIPGRPFEVVGELPVEGNAIAVSSGLILVGDAENNMAYLLEETSRGFRFSQSVLPARTGAGSDSPLFGSAVTILPGPRLVIGAPGPGAESPAGQIHERTVTDGPVGCTVVGTDGPDQIMTPESVGIQTVCGLGGDDSLVGTNGSDVLLGGAGDDQLRASARGGTLDGGRGLDDCQQAGPAIAAAIIINCEE